MGRSRDGAIKVDKVCWEQRKVHGCSTCKHYGNPDSPAVCSECLHGKECRWEMKPERLFRAFREKKEGT